MSAIAAEKLVRLGYTNVWNLQGGMMAWEKAGYRLSFKNRADDSQNPAPSPPHAGVRGQ
ncbi:MAG: hypothetical protein IDH49_04670 [Gammaproteobacteria bacterium]|nr:hypothetical protein [Gammaproteobacteria bacterium]